MITKIVTLDMITKNNNKNNSNDIKKRHKNTVYHNARI
jgi:hypothetical protein